MTGEDDYKLKKLDVEAKEEGDHHTNNTKLNTKAVPSSSRQWSAFKNPRIVRVSRAFGGKDRHSKVTTVRGLRDRRIRLSVPTAIQLYDLQDRLGLTQPSKVVDWLLDATKHDIDQLPPLQIPPGSFSHFHQSSLNLESNTLKSSFSPFFNENLAFLKDGTTPSSIPIKDGVRENSNFGDEEDIIGKSKAWELGASEQNRDEDSNFIPQVSAQNFFPTSSHSSFPNMLSNSMAYNSFYHLEPNSTLSLSQFENHGFQPHIDHGTNTSRLFVYPSVPTPSIFPLHPPPYINAPSESDTRHVNMFLPNPTFMPSLHLHSQGQDEKDLNKRSNGS